MRHSTKGDIIFAMLDTTTLEGKPKQQWTLVFVSFIVLLSVICMEIMNLHYDSLARYPYKDVNSRNLIRQYLTQEEIEYIIEYSIPPNMFIAYIQEDGFNIYHAAEYKKLSESQWDKSPATIVKMVEETRDIMSVDDLETLLLDGNYTYDDVRHYINEEMTDGNILLQYAFNTDSYLDGTHTVSTRRPYLQYLSEEIPTLDGAAVEVSEAIQQPLLSLCGGITSAYNSTKACAGLVVENGYVSWNDQNKAYEASISSHGESAAYYTSPAGHDEHQLGLSVDFAVPGLSRNDFDKSYQAAWLHENAWKYGFVETWNEADQTFTNHIAEPWHYRFVGTDLAKTIHESGLSFARYKAQIN